MRISGYGPASRPPGRGPTDYLERLARRHEELAAFTCPDPSGGPSAPCFGIGQHDVTGSPLIRWGDGVTRCPASRRLECALGVELLGRLEQRHASERRAEWVRQAEERGIPARFVDAHLETSESTPAIEHARAFLDDGARRGRALILLGPPGIGKTWATAGAVRAWHAREPGPARFLDCAELGNELADWDLRAEAIADAEAPAFLALDDFGRGYVKPEGFIASGLEEILAHRHAHLLATLVTSNATPRQLQARLTDRLVDRLREWADVVSLPGPSRRR